MLNKHTKIIIAGFGGQGVVLAGNILARAAVMEDKHVTGMVSYGAEMRGGTANSTVIISDTKIASPFVVTPDVAIILNQPSLDRFEPSIIKNGLAVINTSLVNQPGSRDDIERVNIEASDIANSLGNKRTANIVILGAFIKKTNLLKPESVIKAVEELFSSKKPALVEVNIKAFNAGLDGVK